MLTILDDNLCQKKEVDLLDHEIFDNYVTQILDDGYKQLTSSKLLPTKNNSQATDLVTCIMS